MKQIIAAILFAGLLSVNLGCEDRITGDDILANMSPELDTRASTDYETKIVMARTVDTNTRSIWDDLGRIFFLDRPLRMGITPTP